MGNAREAFEGRVREYRPCLEQSADVWHVYDLKREPLGFVHGTEYLTLIADEECDGTTLYLINARTGELREV